MKKLVALFGMLLLSTSVQAVVFDFAAEGNRIETGYSPSFATGITDGNPMPEGLKISATTGGKDGEVAYVYMDGDLKGDDGGMGVCGMLNIDGGCDPSTDDNQVAGETVSITTTDEGNITHIQVRGDHEAVLKGTTLVYEIDSGAHSLDIGGQTGAIWLALESASSFLSYTIIGPKEAAMYLSALRTDLTAVPLPAAVWLFGTAMLGLIGLRRKSKMGATAA